MAKMSQIAMIGLCLKHIFDHIQDNSPTTSLCEIQLILQSSIATWSIIEFLNTTLQIFNLSGVNHQLADAFDMYSTHLSKKKKFISRIPIFHMVMAPLVGSIT